MSVRRKRSSSSPEPDVRSMFTTSSAGDEAKKNKTASEIDEVGLIAPENAWTVDTSAIFPPKEDRGIRIICVAEKLRVHYDLLLEVLPTYIGSCALVKDPAQSILGNDEHPIRLKPGISAETNHFLKLGVLHPMGGGQTALDSVVVIDAHNRRRLVVPFGWGAGRHVMDAAGGKVIMERLMSVFIHALGELLQGK